MLEAIPGSEDRLRVLFAAPPTATHVTLFLRIVGQDWKMVNSATGKRVETPSGATAHPATDKSCVVTGLEAGTAYECQLTAKNAFGWSSTSACSAPLTLEGEAVEFAGSRSWAEKDEELRKRAIDVENEPEEQGTQQANKVQSKVVEVKRQRGA